MAAVNMLDPRDVPKIGVPANDEGKDITGETPMPSEGPLTDAELLAMLQEELRDGETYTDEIIGEERDKALNYYLGRSMGDERQGRSQVISREVYKVVEGIATAVVELYVQAKDPVKFSPRGKDDEQKAEQRTAACDHVFFTQNDGFLSIVEAIKDGILLKTGFLTWRWESERRLTRERYRGLNYMQLALLEQDNPSLRVVDMQMGEPTQGPDGQQMPTFDCVVDIVNTKGRVIVESIPPEEVVVSSRTRSANLQRSPAVTWRTHKTRVELMKCGYDLEKLEDLAFSGAQRAGSDSPVQRKAGEAAGDGVDEETRINTTWIELDRDGDGIVELHRVVWGEGGIIEDEITDEISIAGWTPNVQPHEYFGRSPADDATDSQEVLTTLKRQTLDNVYWANNPMLRIDPSDKSVNINDFYDPEIGRPVRAAAGAAEAIIFPFVAQHSLPLIEMEQSDQEQKTGYTRYSQGMDAQSLNQTARGISIISSMSQQRIRMMARLFGELCYKPAIRGVAKLLSQYGDKAISVRLRGEYVDVDPREWSEEYDMTVDVGIGVADREQQLMHLTTIAAAQAQAAASPLMGRLVTEGNLFNVQTKIAELAGFKDPTFAWTDPKTVPPQPPPPDPEMIKQQAEDKRHQQTLMADVQKERAKGQITLQSKQLEIASNERMEQQRLQSDVMREQITGDTNIRVAAVSKPDPASTNISVDGQGTLEQVAQVLVQMSMNSQQQVAEAMQAIVATQQSMLALMAKLGAPKRIVRGPDGKAMGVETVDEQQQQQPPMQ